MKIEISGHHLEVTDDIRSYATEKAEGLSHFFNGITSVHVMIMAEKERRIAEVVANISHGAPVIGRATVEGENVYTAINLAADKVEAQLRKHKEKIRERRIREATAEPEAPDAEPEEEESVPIRCPSDPIRALGLRQGLARNEPVGPVIPLFELEIEIPNPQGFHMRPAQKVLSLANEFGSEITIWKDDRGFNAKNILGLLQLVAHQGSKLTIRASGEDAEAAVRALADLVRRGFDEMPE